MRIRTQLITGFSILAVIVMIMQLFTAKSLSSLSDAKNWLRHTHEVIGNTWRVEKLTLDMETGMRGFLLTGDDAFLHPYLEANDQYRNTITQLNALVSDNPAQVNRLNEIDQRIMHWKKTFAEPIIKQHRKPAAKSANEASTVSANGAAILIPIGGGKKGMDEIRSATSSFLSTEQDLLVERHALTDLAEQRNRLVMVMGTLLFLCISAISVFSIIRSILHQVGGEPAAIAAITNRIASGRFDMDASTGRETGILAAVYIMFDSLKRTHQEISDQNWLTEGVTGLDDAMRGTKNLDVLCEDITAYLARYMDVQVGTLSLANHDHSRLILTASYAFKGKQAIATEFLFGDGLSGQVAKEKKQIIVRDVKESHMTVKSALGEHIPNSIVCSPLLYEGDIQGVVELGSLHPFTDLQLEFLAQAVERIAIAIQAAQTRERMKELLEESQAQSEELETQHEELREANATLQEKNMLLRTLQTDSESEKSNQER